MFARQRCTRSRFESVRQTLCTEATSEILSVLRPPYSRSNILLASLTLWYSKMGVIEGKRGTSGIQGIGTSSSRADTSSGLSDTNRARPLGWSGPVGVCSRVGHNSVLPHSCIMPGKR